MKTVIICAGGPVEEVMDFTPEQMEQAVFIGADRGATYLLNCGILPTEAIGDFDSTSPQEFERVSRLIKHIEQYEMEKNETDTELALERAMTYQPKEVLLTGVTGGRLDHMESALHVMYRMHRSYPETIFTIVNKGNELSFLSSGLHEVRRKIHLPYISFFAYHGTIRPMNLRGFKYEVFDDEIYKGTTRFTSNELVEEIGTVRFDEGVCLMIRTVDR